jgi:hypothetical protein
MELQDIRSKAETQLSAVFPPELRYNRAIDRVADRQVLYRLFRSAEIFPKASYIHDAIVEVVASFTAHHRTLIEHYPT